MKKIVLISMLALVGGIFTAEAQILKKLGKTAERAAERTVNRRVATETSKKTDPDQNIHWTKFNRYFTYDLARSPTF